MNWYNDNKATFWVGVVVLAVVVYWIAQNWHPIPPQCDQVTLGLITSAPNESGSPAKYGWTCDNGQSIIVTYEDGSTHTFVVPTPEP